MAAEVRIIISSQSQGTSIADAKRDLRDLSDTAARSGSGFSSMRQVAIGALREIGSLAVHALGQAAQAVGGFLKDSIGIAGDFQANMLEFQAIAGQEVDTAGLDKFRSLFIKIGKELPVSTAEVQKAATEMVKGGISPAVVAAGGLESTIKFAAAAMGGDLVAAAETSAKIVGGWADVTATAEDKANLLTQATDLLTKAANASTVDVHDLALGLYNVQGTAKTTGLSLEETTTALAELAPRFSNANTAGTSFRNFLIRLQPTTDNAKDTMQALGLYTEETGSAFFDSKGEFVGIAKASQMLQEATAGLSDAEKTLALQTIFGNDAMNAAAAFAEMGADGYNQMSAALENANGVSANAELKQQGLNTAMENFKGSVEALQITIGTLLLPILTELFNNYLAPGVNILTNIASAVSGDADAFARLPSILTEVIGFIDRIISAVRIWESGVVSGKTILQSFGIDAETARILAIAVDAIRGFIASVIAAFQDGGITAAIDVVIDKIAEFSPAIALLKGVFDAVFPAIKQIVVLVFSDIALFLQENGATMLEQAQTTWGTIKSTIESLVAPIVAIVQALLSQVMMFWRRHGEEILAFIAYVWGEINTIIQLALQLIQATVIPLLQGIAAFINAHGAEIQALLTIAWNQIKLVIDTALTLIKGVITAALQIIKGDWSGAWETIKQMCATVVQNLFNIIKLGFDNIRIMFNLIWQTISHDFFSTLDGIVNGVTLTMIAIRDAITGFAGKVASAAAGVANAIVGGIADGIKNGASSIINAAKDAAMAALNAAKSALGISSPSAVFSQQIGLPMSQGMAQGMLSGVPLVVQAADVTAGAAVASASRRATTNNNQRTVSAVFNYNNIPNPPSMDSSIVQSLAGV